MKKRAAVAHRRKDMPAVSIFKLLLLAGRLSSDPSLPTGAESFLHSFSSADDFPPSYPFTPSFPIRVPSSPTMCRSALRPSFPNDPSHSPKPTPVPKPTQNYRADVSKIQRRLIGKSNAAVSENTQTRCRIEFGNRKIGTRYWKSN
ncbi:unnamed protein product, partial [Phaeothamnion confervicola]